MSLLCVTVRLLNDRFYIYPKSGLCNPITEYVPYKRFVQKIIECGLYCIDIIFLYLGDVFSYCCTPTCLALSRAEAKAGFLAAASSADPAEVLPGNSLLMLHSELTVAHSGLGR